MKKVLTIIFLSWILVSCSNNIWANIPQNNPQIIKEQKVEKTNLKTVWVLEFKKELAKNDWVLIDLRTSEEVANWVIPWAKLNLDYYSTNFKDKLNLLDKNKKYLIYCRSGHRSGNTFELMKKLGFKNVINLEWWMISWVNAWLKLAEFNDEKFISLEEVKKHSKAWDCYTILDWKVYDISSFFGVHPGWDENLLKICWIDWTELFKNKHWANEKAMIKKEKFYIWYLK